MAKQELSIPSLMKRLDSEAAAYELLEELRWNGEPVCPHCGVIGGHYFLKAKDDAGRKTRTGTRSERRVWKCKACRRQFTVLVGTIFHGTKISLRTWVLVVLEMCASKNGVSAREIERKYDLTAKTAWFMLHRIREAMSGDPLRGLLSGAVVSDETWIGGKPSNRPKTQRRRTGDGRGNKWLSDDPNKTVVLSLVQPETGEVRSRVIADLSGPSLAKAIHEQVDVNNSTLTTDEWKGYNQVGQDFISHDRVNHAKDNYMTQAGRTTNYAEGYFSQLKRSINGTNHHVSAEHLPRYLAQFDFLYSNRTVSDSQRMVRLVENTMGRRLSYKPLTGQA